MSESKRNYYNILGVLYGADDNTIRNAYHSRSRKLHPDRKPPDKRDSATKHQAELNEAYATLSDPVKRRAYDESLPPAPRFVPDEIDFGEVEIGKSGSARLLTLRNEGGKGKGRLLLKAPPLEGVFWSGAVRRRAHSHPRVLAEFDIVCKLPANLNVGRHTEKLAIDVGGVTAEATIIVVAISKRRPSSDSTSAPKPSPPKPRAASPPPPPAGTGTRPAAEPLPTTASSPPPTTASPTGASDSSARHYPASPDVSLSRPTDHRDPDPPSSSTLTPSDATVADASDSGRAGPPPLPPITTPSYVAGRSGPDPMIVLVTGLAIGLVLVLVVLVGIIIELPRQTTTGPTIAPPQSQPAAALQSIQITDPAKQSPPVREPRNVSVTGVGDIPQGHHLWIFEYAPGIQLYYPQGKVDSPNLNPWTIPVIVGSDNPDENGSIFSVCALVTDDGTDARILADGTRGYSKEEWQASFQRFVVDWTQVQRSDPGQVPTPPVPVPFQECGSS